MASFCKCSAWLSSTPMGDDARKGSVVPPLLTLALGVAVLIISTDIRAGMLTNDPGPAFLPRIAGVALVVLSLWLLVHREAHEGLPRGGALLRVVMTIAFTVMYLSILEPFGFPAATALFLLCQMWLIGVRRPLILLVLPVMISAATYAVFRIGLDVPLPATRIGGLLI